MAVGSVAQYSYASESHPCRLLGLELRPLAGRRLLPAAAAGPRLAPVLCRAVPHRGGECELLPTTPPRLRRTLGRFHARGVRVQPQGEPLHHAREATARDGKAHLDPARADRTALGITEARAAAVAAAGPIPSRRRASGGVARRVSPRPPPRDRVPPRELVCR